MGLNKHYTGQEQAENFNRRICYAIKDKVPEVAKIIGEGGIPLEAYIENFYVRTVYNLGFAGERCALPIEVSLRLLEFYLLFEDVDSEHFIFIVIKMLQLKLNKIQTLD